jgi:hypothetical protein
MGKTEGKKPFGRTRRGWKDNIKIELTETGWHVLCIKTEQKEGSCKHSNKLGSIKFGELLD